MDLLNSGDRKRFIRQLSKTDKALAFDLLVAHLTVSRIERKIERLDSISDREQKRLARANFEIKTIQLINRNVELV